MLENTPNQPSNFRTKKWVEINGDARGWYNTNSQIKFKISMLKSSLCDYSDGYIFVSGTIIITGEGDNDAAKRADERNKGVIFRNCPPFTDSISEINNLPPIDNAQGIGDVMLMYKFIEYSDNYSKTSGSSW